MSIKIINVVGARPNFMKIAPIMDEMNKNKNFEPLLLHTGQHYDANMSDVFFKELNIPRPDITLNIGSLSHAKQVAQIMDKFEDVCIDKKPDAILVVGDVNSTMACSIVASKIGVKVIHLEAGLRSFDRTMPEEINRIVTDSIADILLTPSLDANENLLREGVSADKITLVGNIMIDTLFRNMRKFENSQIIEKLNLTNTQHVLFTLHRPSNVDNIQNLTNIVDAIAKIQDKIKVVFPIHPRTRKTIANFGLTEKIDHMPNLLLTEPLGYLDFQQLMTKARFVVTDSGGVQEETTALRIPCITLRENTERPVTVTEGSNVLVGYDMQKLIRCANEILNNNWKTSRIPDLWDGNTAQRVVSALEVQLLAKA